MVTVLEIERKYLIKNIPFDPEEYPHYEISQGYVSTNPAVRIRKKNDRYILTIKTGGLLARQEFEKEIDEKDFNELSEMVSGNIITKTRYKIPYMGHTIELDIFHEDFDGLIYAEVEFESLEDAKSFIAPDYFYKEVTDDGSYQNASLSSLSKKEIRDFLTRNL